MDKNNRKSKRVFDLSKDELSPTVTKINKTSNFFIKKYILLITVVLFTLVIFFIFLFKCDFSNKYEKLHIFFNSLKHELQNKKLNTIVLNEKIQQLNNELDKIKDTDISSADDKEFKTAIELLENAKKEINKIATNKQQIEDVDTSKINEIQNPEKTIVTKIEEVKPEPQNLIDSDLKVDAVIRGEYGVGIDRINKLGKEYKEIQEKVNIKIKNTTNGY